MSDERPGVYESGGGFVRGCVTVLALMFVVGVMLFAIALGALWVLREVSP